MSTEQHRNERGFTHDHDDEEARYSAAEWFGCEPDDLERREDATGFYLRPKQEK